MTEQDLDGGVAIIAMAGRFPGAESPEQLWRVLRDGRCTATRFSRVALDPSIPRQLVEDPDYVPVRGVLADADKFDAAYFNFSVREAQIMDPQQRVFLELAVETLERAGYYGDDHDALIGVYAGLSNITYFRDHVAGRSDLIEHVGSLAAMMANEKDYLTTRVSHKLDLRGPSVNVSTACSTSLVAVAHAFYALETYQCDLALAGGISITTPQNRGYRYEEGGILSPDGLCRPFEARAAGTFFSNGGAIVALKRLRDAVEDDDRIYAILRGVAVNNDGAKRASFAAPGVDGQARAIAMALANAGVTGDDIGFVEAHGTATALGDPIEVAALTHAYRADTQRRGFCALGSLKGNIGHLDVAAGVAGLIKTAFVLGHGEIPPTAHYEQPNPEIDFDESPFYVSKELHAWRGTAERRLAGVSSFGSGGTNAHVIVEAPPPLRQSKRSARRHQVLLTSAQTEHTLERLRSSLEDCLRSSVEEEPDNAEFTLQVGRRRFSHRSAIVWDGASRLGKSTLTRHTQVANPPIVFMFPGQGAQYAGMTRPLYAQEAAFRSAFDECAQLFDVILERSISELVHGVDTDDLLRETRFAQPALFLVEYALARLWMSWGVRPESMIGHSVGELVAAHFAGVLSLEDAAMLVAKRGKLMQAMPAGSMLSVRLPATEVEPELSGGLCIAAENGPRSSVAAGAEAQIAELENRLNAAGVLCKRLRTSHAFHSASMEPAARAFAETVAKVRLAAPRTAFISCVTGTWITDRQAMDASYWGDQLRRPVRFGPGVQTLWSENGRRAMLEVGPGGACAAMARQQITDPKTQLAVSSLGEAGGSVETETAALAAAIGSLWCAGLELDWRAYHSGEPRRRVLLPTYPFERARHWVEARVENQSSERAPTPRRSDEDATVDHNEVEVLPARGDRRAFIVGLLKEMLSEATGAQPADIDADAGFLQMGLDSLLLAQLRQQLRKQFSVDIAFRRLVDELDSPAALAEHLDRELPADRFRPQGAEARGEETVSAQPAGADAPATRSLLERVVAEQMQIMRDQISMLKALGSAPASAHAPAPTRSSPASSGEAARAGSASRGARIERKAASELTPHQRQALADLVSRYSAKTKTSKASTQRDRAALADPRSVSGFSPTLKELVYPLVCNRSEGAYVWDIDGNRYIDYTNGFGPIMLGHSPAFLSEAVMAQIARGIETGPQTPLAGEVAELMRELTGLERFAFCNTGSEAVLAAVRLARAVSGRDRIVVFDGAYHGINDEMLVRRGHADNALPAAVGVPAASVSNVSVLEYGSPAALDFVRDRLDELAAVLVEPVQSRKPELQPREFLRELRAMTEAADTALIFDEIVTGFRVHPGGAQAYFGISADLATYGKVMGGGYPIGVVGGRAKYMDALDGGQWSFGNDSVPEVGVTFFAGTFVRHPLVLAAARAVLKHLKAAGPALQNGLNRKTDELCGRLRNSIRSFGAPLNVEHFSSWFHLTYRSSQPFGTLFFCMMRERGIHIWENRPCFLTTAHTQEDLDAFVEAFESSIGEMLRGGFFASDLAAPTPAIRAGAADDSSRPPVAGARAGRDPQGNPGWYVPDPERPGKYALLRSAS
jgi:acyl transferase domain-containing protein